MKKFARSLVTATALCLTLSACGTFFDKDNTPPPSPLVNFTPEAQVQSLWSTSTGSGSGDEYLKLSPSISGQWIYTSSKNGTVAATDKTSGKTLWQVNTKAPISSGTATQNGLVLVGTRNGQLIALQQSNGQLLWKTNTSSEVLAAPAVSGNIALAKTIDGHVSAFSTADGHSLWQYEQAEPTLILRGSSSPQLSNGSTIVGFENGDLVKLSLRQGNVMWEQSIAQPEGTFSIQRMIDIDADPIIAGNQVYAATYQGRVAALSFANGRTIWSHDISSYAGIATDGRKVYVSDAKSHVWAFDATNGSVVWQQNQLEARNITGPAVIGNYVVVGDAQGYLHWINKQTGHFAARTYVSHGGILATPLVDNEALYVYSKDGRLSAYTVR